MKLTLLCKLHEFRSMEIGSLVDYGAIRSDWSNEYDDVKICISQNHGSRNNEIISEVHITNIFF